MEDNFKIIIIQSMPSCYLTASLIKAVKHIIHGIHSGSNLQCFTYYTIHDGL